MNISVVKFKWFILEAEKGPESLMQLGILLNLLKDRK